MIRLTGHAENREGFVLQRTFTYSGNSVVDGMVLDFTVTLVDTGTTPDQWQCRAEFENFDSERRCKQFSESEAIGSGSDPESALRKLADNLRRVADAIDGPNRLYNSPREMPPWVFPPPEPENKVEEDAEPAPTRSKRKR